MINQPDIKITIGITTYDRPEFLKEAVNSVLNQSYKNFELIISNDFIEAPISFSSLGIKSDSRIRIVNQKKNLSEVRNMNFLLESAKNEWFVWLADDDLMHLEFLEYVSNIIRKEKNKNIVGYFSNYISANSPVDLFPSKLSSNAPIYYKSSDFLNDYSARKCSLIGCYGVMRADILKKIGGMPYLGNSFSPYSDTLLPILLIEFGDICWINEPLIFVRTHEEALSCKSSSFSAYTSAETDFLLQLKRICEKKDLTCSTSRIMANMISWFSKNEWIVLFRGSSSPTFSLIKRFINYQVFVNLPRLSFKYKLNHIMFIVRMTSKTFLLVIFQRFQNGL